MKKLIVFTLCILLMFAMAIPVFAEDAAAEVAETTEVASLFEGLTTDDIVEWVKGNFEEISVIASLIVTLFYQLKKNASLNTSINTTNDNAVIIAENSKEVARVSLKLLEAAKKEVEDLLKEVRDNAEEKAKLKAIITEINTNFQTAKLANLELANEVAELLVLANIPNSVKEELFSRHRAAVAAIAEAERTEVKEDEGKES